MCTYSAGWVSRLYVDTNQSTYNKQSLMDICVCSMSVWAVVCGNECINKNTF